MIVQVVSHQEHFKVPTLRPDARGFVVGERALVRLSILPQLARFFAALSQEQNLDGLIATLRILRVRNPIGGVDLVLDVPVHNAYLIDRLAQIARLLKGEVYTGAWPHFVHYRDRQGPLGYDAQRLEVAREQEVLLYTHSGTMRFAVAGEMNFASVVLELSLMRNDAPSSAHAVLSVPMGLRQAVQRFLWRRRVPAKVAQIVALPKDQFSRPEQRVLFEVAQMPERLNGLFGAMPGVEIYQQLTAQIFVQRGWRHPFTLENCSAVFLRERLYFFSGSRDRVDVVDGAPVFVDIAHLEAQVFHLPMEPVAHGLMGGADARAIVGQKAATFRGEAIGDAVHYQVEMQERPSTGEQVTAVLLREVRELTWLKRLVFSLPSAAFADYLAAYTSEGVLVVAERGVEWIPFGLGLYQGYPQVFMPVGTYLAPPVPFAHLQAQLRLNESFVYALLSPQEGLAFSRADLQPLSRYLVAEIPMHRVEVRSPDHLALAASAGGSSRAEVRLHAQPVSRFALWSENILAEPLLEGAKALGVDES